MYPCHVHYMIDHVTEYNVKGPVSCMDTSSKNCVTSPNTNVLQHCLSGMRPLCTALQLRCAGLLFNMPTEHLPDMNKANALLLAHET